jgi:hypothetical protein
MMPNGGPVSEWTVEKSFDSASACEAGKKQYWIDVFKALGPNPSPELLGKVMFENSKLTCIASDDPRLKP